MGKIFKGLIKEWVRQRKRKEDFMNLRNKNNTKINGYKKGRKNREGFNNLQVNNTNVLGWLICFFIVICIILFIFSRY